ncbi:MAG: hypothetical protein ACREMB_16040 [Candidatus Rokuibacteriota bacterium]
MDLRYFEIHDLLCDALIALEAGDPETAAARVRKALAWAEAEWLATPSALPGAAPARAPDSGADGEDD